MPRISGLSEKKTGAPTARGVTSRRLRASFSEPRFIHFQSGCAVPRLGYRELARSCSPGPRLAPLCGRFPGAARTWHPGGWGLSSGPADSSPAGECGVGEARPARSSRKVRGACVGGDLGLHPPPSAPSAATPPRRVRDADRAGKRRPSDGGRQEGREAQAKRNSGHRDADSQSLPRSRHLWQKWEATMGL